MTAKQLKAWASTLHDEALIQQKSRYGSEWEDFEPQNIRASLVSSPVLDFTDCNNLENIR